MNLLSGEIIQRHIHKPTRIIRLHMGYYGSESEHWPGCQYLIAVNGYLASLVDEHQGQLNAALVYR